MFTLLHVFISKSSSPSSWSFRSSPHPYTHTDMRHRHHITIDLITFSHRPLSPSPHHPESEHDCHLPQLSVPQPSPCPRLSQSPSPSHPCPLVPGLLQAETCPPSSPPPTRPSPFLTRLPPGSLPSIPRPYHLCPPPPPTPNSHAPPLPTLTPGYPTPGLGERPPHVPPPPCHSVIIASHFEFILRNKKFKKTKKKNCWHGQAGVWHPAWPLSRETLTESANCSDPVSPNTKF